MKAYIVEKSHLEHNIRTLKELSGGAEIYGVIKGNGYGLGLIQLAEVLSAQGIGSFAVTDLRDVRALREQGFDTQEILMMDGTAIPEELAELLSLNATATVGSMECALAMEKAAAEQEKQFPCHLKLDTGMGRFGFLPGQIEDMKAVLALPHLTVTGIYTHFHSAFCNEDATKAQFAAFKAVCQELEATGICLKKHCCNSSAFLKYPEMHMDAVRLGSALLGRLSFRNDLDLRRIGWCEAPVELIRTLPKGHTVGYGAPWQAKKDTTIAICGIGYFHGFGTEHADDLFRFRDCVRGGLSYVKAWLKKKAIYASVNGKACRVLGHIGMVGTILDVTGMDIAVGDTVRFEINPLMQKSLDIVYR